MMMQVSALSTDTNNIEKTELDRRKNQFLDYAATHPDAKLKYTASDMHLWAHNDASYLSEPKTRSRAGGFYFLSSMPRLPIQANDPPPPINGAIAVKSKSIDAVMSSVQEAETGAGFYNAKELLPLRQALEELGHPQGLTPIQFDNHSAIQILNDEVSQKRSKVMDMRYYWLRDRAKQQQFHIHWKSGTKNLADYFTKNHSPSHHRKMRPVFLAESKTKNSVCFFHAILTPFSSTSLVVMEFAATGGNAGGGGRLVVVFLICWSNKFNIVADFEVLFFGDY